MTDATHPTFVHPLQRLARRNRLVVAVRGAAGCGKSYFAASLADAGQGRLCLFDTERKARLIPGSDGTRFDALEINTPDELPEFITWALTEGREQRQYACFALDSFALYFGRKHAQTLQRLREEAGDPLAQPTADQLAADQLIFQEVLRRLCVDSGSCVVITDQIPARGREEHTENEVGRVLPMTLSGLEYFVDVLLELEVRLEGFETIRVGRVVKSNSEAFPLGLEIKNPTFADLLKRQTEFSTANAGDTIPTRQPETMGGSALTGQVAGGGATGASGTHNALEAEVDHILREAAARAQEEAAQTKEEAAARARLTFADLVLHAAQFGVTRDKLLVAVQHYHKVTDPNLLKPDQIADLERRLTERYDSTPPTSQPAQTATPPDPAPRPTSSPSSGTPTSAAPGSAPSSEHARQARVAASARPTNRSHPSDKGERATR